ncbi:MAG: OB-fold nucleic acid binding domain-containing protein [Euryarchaeota archaeon]
MSESEELSRRYPAVRVPAGVLARSSPTDDGFVTPDGVRFHRALVVGVVSSKYVDEDREFAVLTITDDTGSVDVFAFEEWFETASELERWMEVKVVGRPMEPREEGRSVPLRAELIRPSSYHEELLRRLEYELTLRRVGEAAEKVEPEARETEGTEKPVEPSEGSEEEAAEEPERPEDLDDVVRKVYERLVEHEEDMFSRQDLYEIISEVVPDADEEFCDRVIKELEKRDLIFPIKLPSGKHWSVVVEWGV